MNYFKILPSASIYPLSKSSINISLSFFHFSSCICLSVISWFRFSISIFKSGTESKISLASSSLAFAWSLPFLVIAFFNKKLLLPPLNMYWWMRTCFYLQPFLNLRICEQLQSQPSYWTLAFQESLILFP